MLSTLFSRHYKKIASRVAVIIVLAVLQPLLWNAVQHTAKQVQAKRSQQQQIGEVAGRVEQMNQALAASQNLVDQLDVVIPVADRLPQIIEQIERLALDQQVNLNIRDIVETSPSAEDETHPLFLPVRVSAQVTGSVPALLAFIDAVEHLPELTFLEGWSLTVIAPTPLPQVIPSPTTTVTLTVHIVFFVQTPHAP